MSRIGSAVMMKRVISIEIGQERTRICEVDYRKKNPKVYNHITFTTPPDVIDDGYIRDKRVLAAVLKDKMESVNMRNTKVVFTIASTKIANREATIPLVKENRIQEVVMASANDYFPIDVNDYNITYLELERMNTEQEKGIRLLVLAAPSSLIKTYYELADLLKLSIVAIDYVGNSSYQVVKNQKEEGVRLMVQMNDQSTIINLLETNCLLLQRTLPYGTDTIAQAVIHNSVFNVETYIEAMEVLKNEEVINNQFTLFEENYSTFTAASEKYNNQLMMENAKEDVTSSLKLLTSNLNRVIDYFTTKHPGKAISKIVITGDGALVNNMEGLIQNEIGIETSKLTELTNITFAKEMELAGVDQNQYLSCIGAAMQPLDFVPKEVLLKETKEKTMMFPLVMLGVSIVGAFTIFLSSYLLYRQTVTEGNRLEEKILEVADIEEIYNNYTSTKAKLGNLEVVHGNTENVSEHLLEFLAELESKTPKGCNVESLQLSSGDITMQVVASSKTLAAKYIESLKTCERVKGVTCGGFSGSSDAGDSDKVSFTVVCNFGQEEVKNADQ
ncbi:MAG: pilus assembly protein PilM [bacterium]|nr:pilus assembly protein PilM [bacterium]